MGKTNQPWGEYYRDVGYVRGEVESLARQLAAMVKALPDGS